MSYAEIPHDRQKATQRRIRQVSVLVSVCAGFYLMYLFTLQIVQGPEYKEQAKELARRATPIPAQRGEIFDRDYDVPLVTNKPSFAVDIIPSAAGERQLPALVQRLSALLGVPADEISSHLPSDPGNVFQPVEIKGGVPYDKIAYIAEHLEGYPGVTWYSKPVREYLSSGSINHVLGYVGDITPEELQVLFNKGYDANSTVGKSGVEKEYDNLLRGIDGKELQVVDAHGQYVSNARAEEIPPENGKNIVLTIDRHIQTLAERALGDRMGSVVVLKPSTGEVLALVSYPWYDPNMFSHSSTGDEMRKVFLDSRFPFLNRAIQSSYAPASTFKIIMTAATLEENAFPATQTINTTGSMVYGGRVWHDWKPNGFGAIDLGEAMAESSDQYFWTIGTKYLGVDRIIEYADRFGLGRKTGIDLPGEVAGLVPTPEWKAKALQEAWVGGDTMNMSIGQGNLQVTPLQLADVVAMVVNKGVTYVPHVLKEVRDPTTGRIIQNVEPRVLDSSGIRPSVFDQVQADMRGVITHGTANVVITTNAVKVAGKTGTGEVGQKDHFTSWFASFAPYGAASPDDQIVVVVMVEATNEWEWWAPKAASIIYQGIFAHQDYDAAVRSLEPVWYLDTSVVGDYDR